MMILSTTKENIMEILNIVALMERYEPSTDIGWENTFQEFEDKEQRRLDRLMSSIQETGIQTPVVISDETGTVWDGLHRLYAAQKLGITEIPTIQDYEWEGEGY
jgi:ParB-like chromosome segregation protein Spo0J